ncbi:MAG: hypothetical protein Q6362_010455 [Candidatus Wukongarchaeota archaeon]|nr:hypothetical protein [Candidatus Wukongarchaeota archaeon]MDO8129834.1 hypothetical protein [Candidatus Wukongarchaeota archaeon]
MVDNEYKDKSEIYKGEKTIIYFTFVMACNDPQFAADFLYRALKKEEKDKLFPILRERVANLLEQEQYDYEANLLRTIKIEEK